MSKNLVIVESPAKAKTIEFFLGKDYTVKSSIGHIRDLPEKKLGVDVENNFEPKYETLPNKAKILNELKEAIKDSEMIWLATDEDREGEAISWHLQEALNIPPEKTKRIVFHEITKTAIIHAIENPRELNINLVNAQQARRVLDRLVGFELSPVLWRKVKPSLSAGRVQSVTVRLVVEKEKEINAFNSTPLYRVIGKFIVNDDVILQAELNTRFKTQKEAEDFLENCKESLFEISSIEKHPAKKTPAPPFTTSTLQQEAARKLSFSVARTMLVAQQLYEAGHITYMRTDSVHLSDLALATTKKEITEAYGKEYSKTRNYQTKSKGAQEAHEAIRPTYINKHTIVTKDSSQEKLYNLIWKRTIASQMSDAALERTTITIDISNSKKKFSTVGEVLLFDGFLKVYLESKDDVEEENTVGMLPALKQGMELQMEQIQAIEKYSQQPYRFTEASLVRKLEELGIGRPSTYAPTISTIQKRQYVIKGNKEGFEREYKTLTLSNKKITTSVNKEKVGFEKGKLYPTDIGNIVNNFLVEHFKDIMNYNFTAGVEKEFDEIAEGKVEWKKMIRDFYQTFHEQVQTTLETAERASGERLLGIDPTTKKNVYSKLARLGPVVQIGDSNTTDELKFSKLLPNQSIDDITLAEAMDLFKLPRTVGSHEEDDLVVSIGRFGPYIRYKEKFYSVPKGEDLFEISMERCLEIMREKIENDKAKAPRIIGKLNELEVSVAIGRYGPYILFNQQFYKLPAGTNILQVTLDEAIEIIKEIEIKNTVKEFTEDTEVKIVKIKKINYIVKGVNKYSIPSRKNAETLTYEDCVKIIEEGKTKSTAKTKTKSTAKSTVKSKTKTAAKTKNTTKTAAKSTAKTKQK